METYLSRKTQLILTDEQKTEINQMIYIRNKAWNKLVEVYNPIVIQNIEQKKNGKNVNILPTQTTLEKFLKPQFKCHSRLLRTCVRNYLESWLRCFQKIGRKPKFHSLRQSELRVNFADCGTKIRSLKSGIVFNLSLTRDCTIDKYIKFHENMSKYVGKEVPI